MQLSSNYIGGFVIILAGLVLIFTSCDEIVIGQVEEGEPVQIYVELYNSISDSITTGSTRKVKSEITPSIEQVKLVLTRTALGNDGYRMFTFILGDSLFYMSGGGERIYISEKVIPQGTYQDINLIFGDPKSSNTENSDELGTFNSADPGAIEVSGIYNNKEFIIRPEGPLELNLEFNSPLKVSKNTDSLRMVTLYFDSSKWFLDSDQTSILDPADPGVSDQIVENILSSVRLGWTTELYAPRDQLRIGIYDTEAMESEGKITFTVELSKTSEKEVKVDYNTSDMSAKAGEDYVQASGTLTFSPGETEGTINVEVQDDEKWEPDERFKVWLSNPVNGNIEYKDMLAKGTIFNDDERKVELPALSIFDAEASESDGNITFTVELSEAFDNQVKVDYETAVNGQAKPGEDYKAISGTLMFAPGETQQEFSVEILNDDIPEQDEKFSVVLSNLINADFERSVNMATGTILNDD